MNAIIGFSDLLIEGTYGRLNKNQCNFLRDIQDSAKHLLNLINQILDISKIESGKLKLKIRSIDLKKTVNQIIGALKPLYQKKNLIFEVLGLKNKTLNADPIRFREILLNLLSNAIKFTMDGKVTLKIDEKYLYVNKEKNRVEISINILEKNLQNILKHGFECYIVEEYPTADELEVERIKLPLLYKMQHVYNE